jgi:hypothetical protein
VVLSSAAGIKGLPYQHPLLGAPVRVKPRILTIVQDLPVPEALERTAEV